jgi:hypothetical protein
MDRINTLYVGNSEFLNVITDGTFSQYWALGG